MPHYLLAVDCSSASKRAIEHTARIISNGDKLTVLAVWAGVHSLATNLLAPGFESAYMKHQEKSSSQEQRKHMARKLLYKVKELLDLELKNANKKVEIEYLTKKSNSKKKEVKKVFQSVKATQIIMGESGGDVELYTSEEMAADAKCLSLKSVAKDLKGKGDVTIIS